MFRRNGYEAASLAAPAPRTVAERPLRGGLQVQTGPCDPRECLGVISTAACGAEAGPISAEVMKRRASSEAAIVRRFEQARADGEFRDGLEAAALIRHLSAVMQGMTSQGGSGATCAELRRLVETGMTIRPTK